MTAGQGSGGLGAQCAFGAVLREPARKLRGTHAFAGRVPLASFVLSASIGRCEKGPSGKGGPFPSRVAGPQWISHGASRIASSFVTLCAPQWSSPRRLLVQWDLAQPRSPHRGDGPMSAGRRRAPAQTTAQHGRAYRSSSQRCHGGVRPTACAPHRANMTSSQPPLKKENKRIHYQHDSFFSRSPITSINHFVSD